MNKYGKRSTLVTPERIIFGTNTINEVGTLVRSYGKNVCLIYGGTSIFKSGNYDRIKSIISKAGITVHEIGGITHDPDEDLVSRVVEKILELSVDVIVGIGGGSVIDTAKAASIIATNGGKVEDYWKGREFTNPSVPYIAVPTTSGTGAEVTKNAVISSKDKSFKKSIRSELMIPNVALVDPSLTLSMPAEVTASTGLDALIQNLEAYTSKNAGPITDTLAHKGIELSGRYLIKAFKNPDDLEAREALSLSSLYGGITLLNAGLGLAHGLSHPIGIRFGIPHGKACAIVMAKVIEYNYSARKDKYDEIGMLLAGVPNAIEAFNRLTSKLGISTRLGDYGITKDDIPSIVEGSKGGSRNYNPVAHDDSIVAKMLEELL